MSKRIYIRNESRDNELDIDEDDESIDSKVEDAIGLVSHPLKCAATILMDSNGSRLRKEDLSSKLREAIRSTRYQSRLKLKTLTEDLLRLEAIRHMKISNIAGGYDIFFELSRKDHFILSLPYFMMEQSIHQGISIEDLIGRTGNKTQANAYANKMRYLLSFYSENNYPSNELTPTPRSLNRGQIHTISDIHQTTIRTIDGRMAKEGHISKKRSAQRKYFMVRPLSEYKTYRPEFRQKLDALIESGKFEVNGTAVPEDFKRALNDEKGHTARKIISTLKKKEFIYSLRDQSMFTLTSKGRHIAEDIFIPIFRALYHNSSKGILESRKRHVDNPQYLIRKYFTTFGR